MTTTTTPDDPNRAVLTAIASMLRVARLVADNLADHLASASPNDTVFDLSVDEIRAATGHLAETVDIMRLLADRLEGGAF